MNQDDYENAWKEGYEKAKRDAGALHFLMDLPSPDDGPFTIQDKTIKAYSEAIQRMAPDNPYTITYA